MIEKATEDEIEVEVVCDDPRHRLCVVRRKPLPIEELIRFVVGPDGAIVPDIRNKLPGRGVWVTADQTAVAEALKTKAFQRSLKKPVRVDAGLPDLIGKLLEKRALEALSFVNKSGELILGFERVLETIGAGKALQIMHGSDAGADGSRKLDGKRAAMAGDTAVTPSIVCFSIDQLSLALGRPNVVHAAFLDGPASRNFIEQTGRLTRYRSG